MWTLGTIVHMESEKYHVLLYFSQKRKASRHAPGLLGTQFGNRGFHAF